MRKYVLLTMLVIAASYLMAFALRPGGFSRGF
jgi:hypothetical protein